MEEEKKLYLGNLSYDLTEEQVKKAIEEKGLTPKEVKVITDKFSGRSKGFGFAEFETEDQAKSAIDVLNGMELSGRPLRVSKAQKMRPRSDRREGGYEGGSSRGGYNSGYGR